MSRATCPGSRRVASLGECRAWPCALAFAVVLVTGCTVAVGSRSPSSSPAFSPVVDPDPSPAFSPVVDPDPSPPFSPVVDPDPSPPPTPCVDPNPSPGFLDPAASSALPPCEVPGESTAPSLPLTTPAPSAANAEFSVPSLVTTVQPDVRVRSKPGLAASSEKLTPLLPRGTELVVMSGPVAADGYHWYEVTPLESGSALPLGWIAAGSKTGEPWLVGRTPVCPARPTTFAALIAIPAQLALVCFHGEPITVEARIVPCECDVDGPAFTPTWFASHWNLLIDPSRTAPSAEMRDLWLSLDPTATRPATLPLGQVVTVTGMFDHPAAAGCVRGEYGNVPAGPTGLCRLWFAVTEIMP